MIGAKAWWLATEAPQSLSKEPTVVTQAGDVLLIPYGMPHKVGTPDYSVHTSFAVLVGGEAL